MTLKRSPEATGILFRADLLLVATTREEFSFDDCAFQAQQGGYTFFAVLDHTSCYGMTDWPEKGNVTATCEKCNGNAFQGTTCGSATAVSIYDPDQVLMKEPPPKEEDAPPSR